MKVLTLVLAVTAGLCLVGSAFATEHYVSAYTKKDGTYVPGHYQTDSNNTRNDNYSTRGNYNPHTGEQGTKPRDEDRNRSGDDNEKSEDNDN